MIAGSSTVRQLCSFCEHKRYFP